ncbi:DUF488 family protein [Chitinophaga agrisoli]|uniref:DUF488 family protein n=1 Tax=Chitinophaga agrisoli TaxID=2607653 RepID=A0A5B2VVA1_9BACT|nr:DUF488 family protein [Chitinophaga agrisoli]
MIKIKRIYEDAKESDGHRILVDRLWPRGVKKEAAAIDAWEKDLAPSPPLRTWFGHKPERWEVFQQRYKEELKENDHVASFVDAHKKDKILTLVYAAKDEAHTHALVLQQYLAYLFDKA